MDIALAELLAKLVTQPGQGSVLEQIDKIVRRAQRIKLYEMLEAIDAIEIVDVEVEPDNMVRQVGKKIPLRLRFFIPKWQGYDEVFWQALGDYIIVALHRVTDVTYDANRGRISVDYFAKMQGRVRSPEEIRGIIQRLVYMVDTEMLPTDFTRFRRMTERRGSLGEMSKEQAAVVGAVLKLL